MTNEEAIYILKNTAWLGTDNGIRVYPAIKKAIEALEKAEKYKKHDLRKNPDDLPPNGTFCMTISVIRDAEDKKFNRRYGFEYGGEGFNQKIEWEVIAWREIEPFEEKI